MQNLLLTKDDFSFWNENGYLIIKNAVPSDYISRLKDTIWNFLEMDRNNPGDWYDKEIRSKSGIDERGIIPFYNHQTIWNNRQYPKIYKAFADLWKTSELLVSIDRLNMNPPQHELWDYKGFIHWDIDVGIRPVPFKLQGLLSLTDCDAKSGGFQCVPGFHNIIEDWLDKQEEGYRSRFPDTTGMEIRNIKMDAGDFIIWHGALPHGNCRNLSDRPRLAQYITMFPKQNVEHSRIHERIESFRLNTPPISPKGTAFPGSPKSVNYHEDIELTELGEKLLGIESW